MAISFSRKKQLRRRHSARRPLAATKRLFLEPLESRELLTVFSNTSAIAIPGAGDGASTGAPASPYPSAITVSGLVGAITDVNVTLFNINHMWPSDIDILLVAPGGQTLMLASDAGDDFIGNAGDLVNLTVTFDDEAATQLPDVDPWAAPGSTVSFRPADYFVGTDAFPAPAPAGPYLNNALSAFDGVSPSGTWNLFAVDDTSAFAGSIVGGWSLDITTTSPEIDVRNFAGASIPDGDTTPSLAKFTDFGSVAVTGGTFTRTFTIRNTGAAPLNLTGNPRVQIGGADAADFTVTQQPSSPVDAGQATTFKVTFNPSARGNRAAFIKILNNDADESSYDFFIKGTGLAPEIDVRNFAGASIADGDTTPSTAKYTDFGSVAVAGGTFTRTFTIANTGNAALNLTGNPRVQIGGADAADFTVTQQSGVASLAPGGTTFFRVTFNPSATGRRAAFVKILNNDPNESSYDFFIQGTGTAFTILAPLETSSQTLAASTDSSATAHLLEPRRKPTPLQVAPTYVPPSSSGTTSTAGNRETNPTLSDLVMQSIGEAGISLLLPDPFKK